MSVLCTDGDYSVRQAGEGTEWASHSEQCSTVKVTDRGRVITVDH